MTVQLNDQQATAILVEGLNRNLYENNGSVPQDENIRLRDATELVEAAIKAGRAGNQSDNVNTILYLAQVDMKPEIPDIKEPSVDINTEILGVNVSQGKAPENNIHNGIDLSTLTDGILDGLISGLDNYPQTEQVEVDRKAYVAEKERRANAQAQISQEIPQAETGGEAAQKAGEIAPEGAPTANEGAGEHTAEAEGPDTGGFAPDGGVGSGIGNEDEDASAFARAQTPETQPEGKVQAKAKPVEEDPERKSIEDQLTLQICRVHEIDIKNLDSVPINRLKYAIENPEGPKMPIDESEVEATAVHSDFKGNSTAGVVSVPTPEISVSKEDLGLVVDENSQQESGGISPDREKLESLVTGPMLKAYGRGRKEIPSIGDNELRFMLLHEDGKVTKEELEAARNKDNSSNSYPAPLETMAENIIENKDRTIVEAAQEVLDKTQIREIALSDEDIITAQQALENPSPPFHGAVNDIIKRENFPIPPDLTEDPPQLPNDISKCSREELFSYHARFHAAESRINWVLCQYEDEHSDLEKLRRNREAIVAASVPFMGEDGKRNTNEYRDSQVNADKEVLELGMKEHEAEKIVKRLKVLQRNYSKDCERLSRQMSRYEREINDGPR